MNSLYVRRPGWTQWAYCLMSSAEVRVESGGAIKIRYQCNTIEREREWAIIYTCMYTYFSNIQCPHVSPVLEAATNWHQVERSPSRPRKYGELAKNQPPGIIEWLDGHGPCDASTRYGSNGRNMTGRGRMSTFARPRTLRHVYIFSYELFQRSGAQRRLIGFVFLGYYENLCFHCNLHAFRKPSSKFKKNIVKGTLFDHHVQNT